MVLQSGPKDHTPSRLLKTLLQFLQSEKRKTEQVKNSTYKVTKKTSKKTSNRDRISVLMIRLDNSASNLLQLKSVLPTTLI